MNDADVQLIKRSTGKQYDAHLLSTDCMYSTALHSML